MIYEFQCKKGHTVEEPRKMADASLPGPSCPSCGADTERRFSLLVWSIQPDWQEAFDWAGKVQRGEIKVAPDKSNEGFLKRTDV